MNHRKSEEQIVKEIERLPEKIKGVIPVKPPKSLLQIFDDRVDEITGEMRTIIEIIDQTFIVPQSDNRDHYRQLLETLRNEIEEEFEE